MNNLILRIPKLQLRVDFIWAITGLALLQFAFTGNFFIIAQAGVPHNAPAKTIKPSSKLKAAGMAVVNNSRNVTINPDHHYNAAALEESAKAQLNVHKILNGKTSGKPPTNNTPLEDLEKRRHDVMKKMGIPNTK